jgi:hypothetical protein
MPQYKLPPLKFYSIGHKNNLIHLFADKLSPRRQNQVQIFNFRRHRSIPQRASVLTSKTGQANVENLAPKASKTSPAWNEDSWFLASAKMKGQHLIQGILKGEVSLYHFDLLFDWFGLVCFANKNKNYQFSYSWFQTSQRGGQRYNDTSPLYYSLLDISTRPSRPLGAATFGETTLPPKNRRNPVETFLSQDVL